MLEECACAQGVCMQRVLVGCVCESDEWTAVPQVMKQTHGSMGHWHDSLPVRAGGLPEPPKVSNGILRTRTENVSGNVPGNP